MREGSDPSPAWGEELVGLRAAFERSMVPRCVTLADGRIVGTNKALCDLVGYSSRELLERTVWDLSHPDDVAASKLYAAACVAGIDSYLEKRFIRRDGSTLWARVHAFRVSSGEPVEIVAEVLDISKDKFAEHQLQQSEETWRKLVEAMPESAFLADNHGRILAANEAMTRLFGKTVEQLIGESAFDLLENDVAARRRVYFEQALRTRQPQRFTDERGGRLVDSRVFPVVNGSGEVNRVAVLGIDITESTRAQERLRRAADDLNAAQRLARLGSWLWRLDSNVVEGSEELHRILGRERTEPLSKAQFAAAHGELGARALTGAVRKALTEGKSFTLELGVELPDNTKRNVVVRGEPVKEPGGAIGVRGTHQDVTEQRQLEAQLRTSQRLDSLGHLAGGIAHDFNNHLTVILNMAKFAVEELPEDHPVRGYAKDIRDAGKRAAGVVRHLLAFSRNQALEPVVLNLNNVVEDMERLLHRMIGEDVKLVTRLAPELAYVRVDPSQMEQVLANLAINARDAMPDGGLLMIETENSEVEEGAASEVPGPGCYVILRVVDSGCGMDENVKARAFEPLFTTKPAGQGTGLGLSTVYGIVTQSGGKIALDSAP